MRPKIERLGNRSGVDVFIHQIHPAGNYLGKTRSADSLKTSPSSANHALDQAVNGSKMAANAGGLTGAAANLASFEVITAVFVVLVPQNQAAGTVLTLNFARRVRAAARPCSCARLAAGAICGVDTWGLGWTNFSRFDWANLLARAWATSSASSKSTCSTKSFFTTERSQPGGLFTPPLKSLPASSSAKFWRRVGSTTLKTFKQADF